MQYYRKRDSKLAQAMARLQNERQVSAMFSNLCGSQNMKASGRQRRLKDKMGENHVKLKHALLKNPPAPLWGTWSAKEDSLTFLIRNRYKCL
jgi:hypothetical protein